MPATVASKASLAVAADFDFLLAITHLPAADTV